MCYMGTKESLNPDPIFALQCWLEKYVKFMDEYQYEFSKQSKIRGKEDEGKRVGVIGLVK